MKNTLIATLLATLLLASSIAHAHITLDQPQALAGTAYKAAFRVGHGCNGSATHTLTVRIPEGFANAKPVPKAGWIIEITRGPKDAIDITWKAASREAWLQDAWYDEFTIRGQTPAQPGPLWFKVRQQCEQGEANWAEIPASGASVEGLKTPAVLLEILPNEHAVHAH